MGEIIVRRVKGMNWTARIGLVLIFTMLGPVDVAELTSLVQASRASDPEPDREALADILMRAAALAVEHQDAIEALYLHRIIVTPRTDKSLVADAQAVLVPRAPAP